MKLGDPCSFSADEVPLDSVKDIDADIQTAVKASQDAIEKALKSKLLFDKASKEYQLMLKAWEAEKAVTHIHTPAEKVAFKLAKDKFEVAEAYFVVDNARSADA